MVAIPTTLDQIAAALEEVREIRALQDQRAYVARMLARMPAYCRSVNQFERSLARLRPTWEHRDEFRQGQRYVQQLIRALNWVALRINEAVDRAIGQGQPGISDRMKGRPSLLIPAPEGAPYRIFEASGGINRFFLDDDGLGATEFDWGTLFGVIAAGGAVSIVLIIALGPLTGIVAILAGIAAIALATTALIAAMERGARAAGDIAPAIAQAAPAVAGSAVAIIAALIVAAFVFGGKRRRRK